MEKEYNFGSEKEGLLGQKVKFPFYLYSNYGAISKTHYFPSGRMGDSLTIRIWGNCKEKPFYGNSCIKIVYDLSDPDRIHSRWAGIYWLNPANNWGIVPNKGYDLRGATKLVFYARGETGEEIIKFTAGGIKGQYPDSGKAPDLEIKLTREWKRYTIPLEGMDLTYIVGGFCWAVNDSFNPAGAVFYLDEIYYTDEE